MMRTQLGLDCTTGITANHCWVFRHFDALAAMGLSESQIKSMPTNVLNGALKDYKQEFPPTIKTKLNAFLTNESSHQLNLSNTQLTLGHLCKVIQLIKDNVTGLWVC